MKSTWRKNNTEFAAIMKAVGFLGIIKRNDRRPKTEEAFPKFFLENINLLSVQPQTINDSCETFVVWTAKKLTLFSNFLSNKTT